MSENSPGRVSVVIPARNEEENIARTVRSVAAQQGVREIIVVDDQSQDRTGEILGELKSEIPLLRTLRVEALPEGWLGKTHAAAKGAREASGEWLLFTDADTEHLPGSLATLLERAEREQADLLSVSPGQETPRWWEKAVIPMVYVHLARQFRFEEVSDPGSPAAAANGQYLLVRRSAYDRAGGHEAVRTEVLEDVELARRMKASAGRLLFLPGSACVRTRMYRTFREMWDGWSKNLYLLYARNLPKVLKISGEVLLFDLMPTLVFIAFSLVLMLGWVNAWPALGSVACFLVAAVRQWSYGRALNALGFDPCLAQYQTIGAGLFSLLLLNSARVHRLSGRVRWKGREYSTRGPVRRSS